MNAYTNIISNNNNDECWTIASNDTSSNSTNQVVDPDNIHSTSPIESTCPTCQGIGKLTQSQADNLVALIPAGDKRLKPRRTKLYLAITAVCCIVCSFLIGFFLWPRQVNLSIIELKSSNIHIEGSGSIYIDVAVIMQLQNKNFIDVYVKNVSNDVTWNKIYNLYTIVKDFHPMNVKSGEVKNFTFITKQIFDGVVKTKVQTSCHFDWNWLLLEKFDFYFKISTMLTSEDTITKSYYGYIACYNSTGYVS